MSTTASIENRSSTLVIHPSEALEIDLGPLLKPMDDDEFFAFCRRNRKLRIEMDKDGEITIMSPTYSETGHINFNITVKVRHFALIICFCDIQKLSFSGVMLRFHER